MYPGESTIDLFDIDDLELRKPEHISDELDGQGEQNNEEDQAEGCVDDPEYESFSYLGNLNMTEGESKGGAKEQFQDFKYKKICLPTTAELNSSARMLVPEQMNVLRKVVKSCKSIVKAKNNPAIKPEPVRLIVHGGAGKTYQNINQLLIM